VVTRSLCLRSGRPPPVPRRPGSARPDLSLPAAAAPRAWFSFGLEMSAAWCLGGGNLGGEADWCGRGGADARISARFVSGACIWGLGWPDLVYNV